MSRPTHYDSTENEMIGAAYIGWDLCKEHKALFQTKFAFYTDTYIDEKVAAVLAAQSLPDHYTRTTNRQLAHNKLEKIRDKGRDMYLDLEEYIKNFYPENDWHALFTSAGHPWFQKSAQENWGALNSMFSAAVSFTHINEADLEKNDNMPTTFLGQLQALQGQAMDAFKDFMKYDVNSEAATAEKNNANNQVYDDLIKMGGHAQRVFSDDPDMASQFTFASLVQVAGKHDIAGVRGTAVNADTDQPLADVEVLTSSKEHDTTTNSTGHFHVKGLGEGKEILTFRHPDFNDVLQEVDLQPGKTIIIHIKLTKKP